MSPNNPHDNCTVPEEIVDAYLERNPVMQRAWEEIGYQVGNNGDASV